jgi:hypothetical protein
VQVRPESASLAADQWSELDRLILDHPQIVRLLVQRAQVEVAHGMDVVPPIQTSMVEQALEQMADAPCLERSAAFADEQRRRVSDWLAPQFFPADELPSGVASDSR